MLNQNPKNHKKSPPKFSFWSLFNEPPTVATRFHLRVLQEYADICKIPGLLGYYLLGNPHYIEHVLKTQYKNYLKTDFAYKAIASVLGKGLLTNPDTDAWSIERRQLQPLFHPQTLPQLAQITVKRCIARCERWEHYAKQKQVINLADEMLSLSFEIMSAALFSEEFSSSQAQFLHFSNIGNNYITRAGFLYPWLPTLTNQKFKTARQQITTILNQVIDRRMASNSNLNSDVLTALLALSSPPGDSPLSRQQLLDHILTFIVTGYETTGTSLAWAWYLLLTHPSTMDQLQAESQSILAGRIPRYEDIPQLTYSRNVIEETLRLYPPIWMITRKSVAPDQLGDYYLPAGATVVISTYALHRHPVYWAEPEIFNPGNFAEANKKQRTRFAYLPFGAGPRACIGSLHALLQAQLILTTISQYYQLELVNKKPVKIEHLITLRPKGGIWVKLHKR